MTVSAKWIEVQKFAHFHGICKLLPLQIHMVHDLQRTGQSNRNMLLGVIPTTDLE